MRARWQVGVLALALGSGVVARADDQGGIAELSSDIVDALTAVDVAPARTTLDDAFGGSAAALPQLVDIATGSLGGTKDAQSIQLRAIRALTHYPSVQARQALADVLAAHQNATVGTALLLRRAATEALGVIGEPEDVALIAPLLEVDDSRDLRAAAALALRDIGASSAIDPLRTRYGHETVDQVRLAISEALRALSPLNP